MKFLSVFLNRLSGKFIAGAVLILLITLSGTLFVNSRIAERFYLHKQCGYVEKIGSRLETALKNGTAPDDAVREIEEKENVLIVYSELTDSPDELAVELRDSFREKGLGFQKFWLWDQDYETVMRDGSKFRLYAQNKMNYGILVQYLSLESGLYAIAAIIPDAKGVIEIVNRMGVLIYFCALLFATGLFVILTRHITNPLSRICEFTRNISMHDYRPVQIKTGDELEDVADSLNEMACEIEQYERKLKEKNEQMKQLLSDVAHDIKTPVSLIGMYASGIKDGLDDGSFLDTIICQNERISGIVERLLHFSRIERGDYPCESLFLDQVLEQSIEEHRVLFSRQNLEIVRRIEPCIRFSGNRELLSEMFSNLLSNAAKYSLPGCVKIELRREQQTCFFCISNMTDNTAVDTKEIWKPFCVGEASRNKELSGTGLGLPIVKKIAEQFGGTVSCGLSGQEISFKIVFPVGD